MFGDVTLRLTGTVGRDPRPGTTRNGKPKASISLAVRPNSNSGPDTLVRWYTVMAYGTLAEHVTASVHKGDFVNVIASDLYSFILTGDGAGEPDSRVCITALDVSPSLRFDTAQTGKAAGQVAAEAQNDFNPFTAEATDPGVGGEAGSQPTSEDPWAEESSINVMDAVAAR